MYKEYISRAHLRKKIEEEINFGFKHITVRILQLWNFFIALQRSPKKVDPPIIM